MRWTKLCGGGSVVSWVGFPYIVLRWKRKAGKENPLLKFIVFSYFNATSHTFTTATRYLVDRVAKNECFLWKNNDAKFQLCQKTDFTKSKWLRVLQAITQCEVVIEYQFVFLHITHVKYLFNFTKDGPNIWVLVNTQWKNVFRWIFALFFTFVRFFFHKLAWLTN